MLYAKLKSPMQTHRRLFMAVQEEIPQMARMVGIRTKTNFKQVRKQIQIFSINVRIAFCSTSDYEVGINGKIQMLLAVRYCMLLTTR